MKIPKIKMLILDVDGTMTDNGIYIDENGIEYRQGSAGGGNQTRQPYVRSLLNFDDQFIVDNFPCTEHIHFYGMYLGNYPELTFEEIDEINTMDECLFKIFFFNNF